MKSEQRRIATEMATIERRLTSAIEYQDRVLQNLGEALEMTSKIASGYQCASTKIRRKYNQAMFKKIYVNRDGITGVELCEPFALLLHPGLVGAAHQHENSVDGRKTPSRSAECFDQLFKDLVNQPEMRTTDPEGVSSLSFEHLVGDIGLEPTTPAV
jgi:hypothetical protein